MIIDLEISIDLRWLLMSCAVFISDDLVAIALLLMLTMSNGIVLTVFGLSLKITKNWSSKIFLIPHPKCRKYRTFETLVKCKLKHFFFPLARDNINNSGNRIRRSWKINFLISGLVKRLLDRKSDTARSWYKWTFLDVVPVLSKKQKPSWQSVCGWGNYRQGMFKKGAVERFHIQMAATEIIIKLSPKGWLAIAKQKPQKWKVKVLLS